MLISLFALFLLICVHYCIDVVAVVVVEIHSIQLNGTLIEGVVCVLQLVSD